MNVKSLIALIVAAAGPGTALPATPASQDSPLSRTAQADRRFGELDRNRDGFLSRDEADEASELNTRFSELDVDNDGKLSRDEYRVVIAGEKETLPGATRAASGATHPR